MKNSSTDMSPLMLTIKAVHTITGNDDTSPELLEKQRNHMELFSKLVPAPLGLIRENLTINNIPALIVRAENSIIKNKLILYCHGGGYTCGKLGYAQILADKLCKHTGIPVLAFEYRLAPENPYPAALNDCISIWDYLMLKGYGSNDIIVAGDSAGGNLALELCLSLQDASRHLPRALILMSPWTDMTMSQNTYQTMADKDPIVTHKYVDSVRKAYAGANADFKNHGLSPIFSSLKNFPPTLIQVGSNEILKGDSEALAKKLLKNGNFVKLTIYKKSWHVFQQMPTAIAASAMNEISSFVSFIFNL